MLDVEDLSIVFPARRGDVKALDRVRLSVRPGEIVGLVGESGSGKSVLSYAVSGLLDPAARVTGGRITWQGHALDPLRERRDRHAPIAQIFQNPRASLNPIRSVGHQLQDVGGKDSVRALLESVRLAPEIAGRYPFELSGGQCQRVGIALALACEPDLLIADEPTTGLDVTTEAAVMGLITELSRSRGMATLLVTHDLPLAATHGHRIAVMHAGQIVETARVSELIGQARHPYSAELLSATPQHAARAEDLHVIRGLLPDLSAPLPPCRFAMRCARHQSDCDAAPLSLTEHTPDHLVACRHPLC
ncbi:MAG: ABC transporter ATP-binding protein [Hyphomicrobiales bacterium]|nr:MAG: ABC transporter ATP-binding protein [Hyphomicrobiales bacterium]